MTEKISLIVAGGAQPPMNVDRAGGEAHGFVSKATDAIVRAVPLDKVADQLQAIADKVGAAVTNLKISAGHWQVDEITIGLSISAEGDIGIATAGVEASIELNFKRPGDAPSSKVQTLTP
jgi:hypothetical protein